MTGQIYSIQFEMTDVPDTWQHPGCIYNYARKRKNLKSASKLILYLNLIEFDC